MKALATFLVLVAFWNTSYAEDSLASGGKSPDGRYEVRIYETGTSDDPSNYSYGVFDTTKGKLIAKLNEGGGFCDYQGTIEMTKVLWNSTGDAFALVDHGTRHSMDLYVNVIRGSGVRQIQVPDYLKDGLSLVGATEDYLTSVVTLLGWKGNSLTCAFTFDAMMNAGRSPFYDTKFTITIKHGKEETARIVSMDRPQAEE
jgi:hypothetical protein